MNMIKKQIIGLALGVAVCVPAAKADFQIDFTTTVNANNPVFDFGGSTVKGANGFVGELFLGTVSGNLSPLTTKAGSPSAIQSFGNTATSDDGYILAGSLTYASMTITSDTAGFYQLAVWNTADGADFATASAKPGAHVGITAEQSVTFRGYVSGNIPPVSGVPQASLQPSLTLSVVPVPEPATMTLGLLGAAGLLMRRRKQQ